MVEVFASSGTRDNRTPREHGESLHGQSIDLPRSGTPPRTLPLASRARHGRAAGAGPPRRGSTPALRDSDDVEPATPRPASAWIVHAAGLWRSLRHEPLRYRRTSTRRDGPARWRAP